MCLITIHRGAFLSPTAAMGFAPPPQRWVALALSLVGGYVDVICIVRYQTFVATMTGK